MLARGDVYPLAFGWYDVTGSSPATGALNEVISCSDGVGTTRTVALDEHPSYAGGPIAFFAASGSGCPTSTANDTLL